MVDNGNEINPADIFRRKRTEIDSNASPAIVSVYFTVIVNTQNTEGGDME